MSNANIEQKLLLASRIVTLRAQLAAAEAEFAGEAKPLQTAPSVSHRVLQMIVNSGPDGLTRADVRSVIPTQEAAVTAAIKTHATAGRIASVNGRWVATERARPDVTAQ